MPPKQYDSRSIVLYFPSASELQIVQAAAEKVGKPYSHFCIEMIRRGMNQPVASPELPELQKELSLTRKELEQKDGEIRGLQAEIFTLKGALLEQPESKGELDSGLIELMQDGRTRRPAEIMRELGIEARDMGAITALVTQLHALQDLGLIQEGPNGWRWIG